MAATSGDDIPIGGAAGRALTAPTTLLVWFGGAVGSALRFGISSAIPDLDGVPMATIGVNIVGAFALGALIHFLVTRTFSPMMSVRLRLLIGTGVLGGFTTYSGLALSAAELVRGDRIALAGCIAGGTVAVGVLGAYGGMLTAGRLTTPADRLRG